MFLDFFKQVRERNWFRLKIDAADLNALQAITFQRMCGERDNRNF
jgi:hypothetical protein